MRKLHKKYNRRKVLLTTLKAGEGGVVWSFLRPGEGPYRRLASLGFLPGEKFLLERKKPGYLIRYGYTRLAINSKVARGIMVCKMEDAFLSGRQMP